MRTNVQQQASTPAQLAQLVQQRSQQPRITVVYQGSDIRDVLAAFAVLLGPHDHPELAASGPLKVDAEIKDQPWDVALQAILAAQGLAATEDANGIIIVDTQERIAARAQTEPLDTRIVRLNYQRATPVGEQIRQRLLLCIPSRARAAAHAPAAPPAGQPPRSSLAQSAHEPPARHPLGDAGATTCRGRGSVTADEETNSVSITGAGQHRRRSRRLRRVARPAPAAGEHQGEDRPREPHRPRRARHQVRSRLGAAVLQQRSFSAPTPPVGTAANDPPRVLLGGNTVSAIANASGNVPGAALRLIYSTALGNFDFSTFLDALQEVNLLDVQAEPSVTIINNKTADLTSGVQVPFVPLVSSGGAGTSLTGPVTVERIQTGVRLLVTPSVTNNRQILMHVEVTNSDVSFTNNGTLIDNNSTKNDVLVADGQTVVIGGLTQTSVRVTKSGIPAARGSAVHRTAVRLHHETGATPRPAHPDHAPHHR